MYNFLLDILRHNCKSMRIAQQMEHNIIKVSVLNYALCIKLSSLILHLSSLIQSLRAQVCHHLAVAAVQPGFVYVTHQACILIDYGQLLG